MAVPSSRNHRIGDAWPLTGSSIRLHVKMIPAPAVFTCLPLGVITKRTPSVEKNRDGSHIGNISWNILHVRVIRMIHVLKTKNGSISCAWSMFDRIVFWLRSSLCPKISSTTRHSITVTPGERHDIWNFDTSALWMQENNNNYIVYLTTIVVERGATEMYWQDM